MLGEQAENRRLAQRWLFKELEEGWGSDRQEGPEVGAMNGAPAAERGWGGRTRGQRAIGRSQWAVGEDRRVAPTICIVGPCSCGVWGVEECRSRRGRAQTNWNRFLEIMLGALSTGCRRAGHGGMLMRVYVAEGGVGAHGTHVWNSLGNGAITQVWSREWPSREWWS